MKKLLITIMIALIGNTMLAMPAFADPSDLKEGTFDVTEYLNLGEGEQKQQYFKGSQQETDKTIPKDTKLSPIVRFILSTIEFATKVIGTIAMIILILAGLLFIVSEGNEQRITAAKDMFKFTIIGLLITFMSYIIVIFVQSLFIQST
ncbi:MAG: hypothetical protein WC873_00630 [Candidatus Gracilibacteria bacterium]